MHRVRFRLVISPESYLAYYAGSARSVSVQGDDGRRYEFAAEHLRQFVTHDGIHGVFELCFDKNRKFLSLNRV